MKFSYFTCVEIQMENNFTHLIKYNIKWVCYKNKNYKQIKKQYTK